MIQGSPWRETVTSLYEKHFDALHRIAYRCLGDRSLVRAVIQEIFTRLLSTTRCFATFEDAERYLFRSFKNLLIDKARSRSRRQYVELARAGDETARESVDHTPAGLETGYSISPTQMAVS